MVFYKNWWLDGLVWAGEFVGGGHHECGDGKDDKWFNDHVGGQIVRNCLDDVNRICAKVVINTNDWMINVRDNMMTTPQARDEQLGML